MAIHAETADPGTGLQCFNGLGGFNGDGEYEIHLTGSDLPPAPWVNVVGNPVAGFIVSEGGSGTTWAGNSFFYRLTPWHNDPVRDPSSDCVFLRDDANGDLWTATPCPIREPTPYKVRHGAGYSVFDHTHKGLASSFRLGVDQNDPVKISVLTLRNDGSTRKKLTLTWYVEWVLGVNRELTQYQIRTTFDEATQSMFARNYFDAQFAETVAFASISERVAYYTADRREFLGRNGTISSPAALERAGLSGAIGATIDPCCALQVSVTIEPGETREIVMLLGAAEGEDAVREIIARNRTAADAKRAVDSNIRDWEKRLGAIKVKTPGADLRPDGEPVVSVPGAVVPHVGAHRAVPVERRVRVPRPAAGRDGVRVCRCGGSQRAHSSSGIPPIRGRRRPALVASADRSRSTNPVLG